MPEMDTLWARIFAFATGTGDAPGMSLKRARLATTANHGLSGTADIDGTVVVAGNRILVKANTAPAENGLYVAAAGAWSRADDATDGNMLRAGTLIFVKEGAAGANTCWALTTNDPITIGATSLVFAQFGAGGAGGVTVRENSGADVGTRPRLNLIEGSNIALTVADDAGDDEVDITVSVTGIAGGGASGTAVVDFGSFPGSTHATVAVTGQVGILTTSQVRVWIRPEATTPPGAANSADEHIIATSLADVAASDIVADTGFTIHMLARDQGGGKLEAPGIGRIQKAHATALNNQMREPNLIGSVGGQTLNMLVGKFNVSWSWS